MHELSLCRSIAGIVGKHAGTRPVSAVNVRIGRLRQVVPDTLVYCWSLVVADGGLAGSTLNVEHVPARLHCAECAATTTIDLPVMICPACRGRRVELLSGEEFMITSFELAEV